MSFANRRKKRRMTKEKIISYLESLLVRCDFEDMYGEPIDSDPYEEAVEEAIDIIRDAPTIDVVKHGRWIDETFKPWGLVYHPYKCDQCGDHSEADFNFCPNCGARMDAERKES